MTNLNSLGEKIIEAAIYYLCHNTEQVSSHRQPYPGGRTVLLDKVTLLFIKLVKEKFEVLERN